MAAPVYCNGCGQRLEVPAGYSKSKMRCAECGVFTDLPKEVREQGQSAAAPHEAQPNPAPAPRPAAPARPSPPPSRQSGGSPRQAPQTALPPIPPPPPSPQSPLSEELEAISGGGYGFQDEPAPPAPAPPPPPRRSPAPAAPSSQSQPAATDVPEREVLIQGTEEEDANPYTVTGDAPTKRCSNCERKISVRAKVCHHCGFNTDTGERSVRTFQPLTYEWESGWPFQKRLGLFIGLQLVNFFLLIVASVSGLGTTTPLTLIVFTIILQAFLCGTFEKLSLSRTQKGKVTMKVTWRIAFVPRPATNTRWKEASGLIIIQSSSADFMDWANAAILTSYLILPGVLFWYYVIRPDKFTVTLCSEHAFPETPIFRTLDQTRAEEVARAVGDATGLPLLK